MLHTKTKEVDLEQYPLEIIQPTAEPKQIVLGDLHGNALKLIYTLIQEGVLEINEAQYQILRSLYYKDPITLTPANLDQFRKILYEAIIHPNISILFLGDTLADRGMNDYYMLLIYAKLARNHVDFKIIFSNHDLQFIIQYEAGLDQPNQTIFTEANYSFGASLLNMQTLISTGKISLSEVNKLIESYYLPYINLLDTEYTKDADGDCTLIYSHTPVTPATIIDLAMQFNIAIHENTSLHEIIQKINAGFLKATNISYAAPFQDEKLYALLNNRYNDLTPFNKNDLIIGRQLKWQLLEKYHAINIHGHVGTEAPKKLLSPWTFINMDTALGMPDHKIGAYKIAIFIPLAAKSESRLQHLSLYPATTDKIKIQHAGECKLKH